MQGDCTETTKSHFCGYDTAGKILTHLLFNIIKSNVTEENWKPKFKDWASKGILKTFDQHEFVDYTGDWKKTDIKDNGYIYYPYA